MVGVSDKVRGRIVLLERLLNQGMKKKDIKRKIMCENGWGKDMFYRAWYSMHTDNVAASSRPKIPSTKREKVCLNKEKTCYFCGDDKVIEHHLSYNPETVVSLCASCHSKLHILIDKYHSSISDKDNRINLLETWVKTVRIATEKEVF